MTPRAKVLIVIFILALGLGVYVATRETPDSAALALSSQGIEVTPDNFIIEIEKVHKDNVAHFIAAGAGAWTQDAKGVSGLMAAVDGSNDVILPMVLATLPKDKDKLAQIMNLQDADGRTALIAAAQRGDLKLTKEFLADGADAAQSNHALETPLIVAIQHRHADLLMPIIEADNAQHQAALSVHSPDSTGNTPLVYAVRAEDPSMIKTLIAAKADIEANDRRGTTPLMVAAEIGSIPAGEQLLAAGAKIDVADRFGETPLIAAIKGGHPDFVKFLIDKGADVDFHTGDTLPLQVAIETEPFNPELFRYLLSRSKQVDNLGSPLLFNAVDHKNSALAKALLERGLNPNIADEKGETLLYHAIETGNEEIALALIDKGADITRTGIPGTTPIERAAERNEIRVVNRLLAMGVSPEQKTAEGYTLAEMAVYRGYPEILDALLAKGAKLQKDFGVLWSIRDGGGRSVPVLLAHGAKTDVMNERGDPALWLAASAGETEAVQALLANHAPVDYPDKTQGMTALAIASHTGQLAVVKILVEAGARLESVDNFGMTPLAHAAYMTKPDVVEYLISKGANTHATDNQKRTIADLAGIAAPTEARDKVMMLLSRK